MEKSTLGRLLTMIETPTGGELYYQGQDLLKHDPHAQKLRRQKNSDCVSEPPTVPWKPHARKWGKFWKSRC